MPMVLLTLLLEPAQAFKAAVLFCVGHELDTFSDSKALQDAYYKNVIARLDACQV